MTPFITETFSVRDHRNMNDSFMGDCDQVKYKKQTPGAMGICMNTGSGHFVPNIIKMKQEKDISF